MGCLIGYMLTWTTYGNWLQGDEKGYTKDGTLYGKDSRMLRANVKHLVKSPVKLGRNHKQLVHDEIHKTADTIGQRILSMAVCSNHIHIVVNNVDDEIGNVVRQYKINTTYVLRKSGVAGKIWTKGYDKQFCYDRKNLQARIEYVQRHCEG